MTNSRLLYLLALACIAVLAGCGGAPGTKAPVGPSSQLPENHRAQFDGGFTLDYQVERKISKLNGKSCYAFITGTLHNQSAQTLSRRSVLDFQVMNQGEQLFRDITHPLTDIPPGGQAMFDLVTSPLHREGCPPYEIISVSLRKVLLN